MFHESQGESVLGLNPREARGGVQETIQLGSLGQFARFRGHTASDLGELLTVGQLVLDHRERFLQLDGELDGRRQDDDERPSLLAGLYLVGQRLDDFGTAEEPVEVDQH